MTADPVLSIAQVDKSFGSTRALDGVQFDVGRGEIMGFLGPNGAGKTTLMKIIMGLEKADAGAVTLLGMPNGASKPEVRRRIGYLQEKPPIYPEMTARGYLAFFARLYDVADPDQRVSEVLDRLALAAAADRTLGGFSRGMQQRTCLARIMLHEPEFLLLDEPTLGLDPAGVADMRRTFLDMQAAGMTLMFSSHQLSEMERICTSLVFLSGGRVIARGAAQDLLPLASAGDLLAAEIAENAETAVNVLKHRDHIDRVELMGEAMIGVKLKESEHLSLNETRAQVSRLIAGAGFTVLSVTHPRTGLEELFMSLTKETTAETRAA